MKKSKAPISTSLFLIKKGIVENFRFQEFVMDIYNKLNTKIEKTYKLSLKGIIFQYSRNTDPEFINDMIMVCEEILFQEFNLVPDMDGYLIFNRNTKKKRHEYAFEALEHLGEPSSVFEINEKVKLLYPNLDSTEDTVRASMTRSKGFISFGRTSTYGLKKWEKQLDGIKGGTIRNMTEEFLTNFPEPQHISAITEHILKFRPNTYERSVLDNLKAEDSGTFRFFTNSHIGLSKKEYDTSKFIPLNQLKERPTKTWDESYELISEFAKEKRRLPKNNIEEELDLYRWLCVQKTHMNRGKMAGIKLKKMLELIGQYSKKFTNSPVKVEERYDELLRFVQRNKRLPNKELYEEKNLYIFYDRQLNLFTANILNERNKEIFTKVLNELKTQ